MLSSKCLSSVTAINSADISRSQGASRPRTLTDSSGARQRGCGRRTAWHSVCRGHGQGDCWVPVRTDGPRGFDSTLCKLVSCMGYQWGPGYIIGFSNTVLPPLLCSLPRLHAERLEGCDVLGRVRPDQGPWLWRGPCRSKRPWFRAASKGGLCAPVAGGGGRGGWTGRWAGETVS